MKTFMTQCKRATAVAAFAFAALVGALPAHALVYSAGDAVLVIYGNEQQGYLNLGNWNTLKANGGTFDVSGILNTLGVSGANTIEYTLVGNSGATTPMWFGNNAPITDWTSTQKTLMNVNAYNTANSNWRAQLTTANDPARQVYAASDPLLSFSTYFFDTDSLGGMIPNGRRGSSDIDSVLHLLERTGGSTTLAQIDKVGLLRSDTKQFVVAPIPVPAAAILFGSGLIGLVGIARRSLKFAR